MLSISTNGISVSVETAYLTSESQPTNFEYYFGYHITIENNSPHTVQLQRRHWDIFDSIGRRYDVDDVGVVGQQPVLEPGEMFEYTSFCILKSEMGRMDGYYTMIRLYDNSRFEVTIPSFELYAPFKFN